MDSQTLVIIVGTYLFLESFTAINEMPKIRLRDFWRDFGNYYAMKYLSVGFYGLWVIYISGRIHGVYLFLILPAIFCVSRRTAFRFRQYRHRQRYRILKKINES